MEQGRVILGEAEYLRRSGRGIATSRLGEVTLRFHGETKRPSSFEQAECSPSLLLDLLNGGFERETGSGDSFTD